MESETILIAVGVFRRLAGHRGDLSRTVCLAMPGARTIGDSSGIRQK